MIYTGKLFFILEEIFNLIETENLYSGKMRTDSKRRTSPTTAVRLFLPIQSKINFCLRTRVSFHMKNLSLGLD